MNDFKNWLNIIEDFGSLPRHANLRKVIDLLDEAQIITQDQGIQLPGADKSANPLVPYGDFKKTDPKTGHTSGFERDQPTLHSYALANPDNMAAVMIFVLLTIHADFRQVMQDFPTIMLHLKHKFNNNSKLDGDKLGASVKDLETRLAQKVNPEKLDKSGFAQGYSLQGTVYGFKKDSVAHIWANRERLYNDIKGMGNDVVKMHQYIVQNIGGLGPVKGGFVVQLITGKLGCLDLHNVNLYSQYAKHYKNRSLYNAIDPANYSKKDQKSIDGYLRVLDKLEKEGANTAKLWDIWVNYVAVNYATDATAYSTSGKMAGHTVSEDDPLYQKLQDIGPVPDRANKTDKTYTAKGRNAGALSASLGHSTIYQMRDKQYWNDLLTGAEDPLNTPDALRVVKPSGVERPHKALAYLHAHPQWASTLGVDDNYMSRLNQVLQRRDLMPGRHMQGRLFAPMALGSGHKPQRGIVSKSKPVIKKKPIDHPSLF